MITSQDLLIGLQVAVFAGLIIVLYHILFIVVDARKIVRRVNTITTEVEKIIMKPMSVADQVLNFAVQSMEGVQKEKKKKKKSTKK